MHAKVKQLALIFTKNHLILFNALPLELMKTKRRVGSETDMYDENRHGMTSENIMKILVKILFNYFLIIFNQGRQKGKDSGSDAAATRSNERHARQIKASRSDS